MHAGRLVALILFGAAAGCAGNEPTNPNLLAPKLVLDARPDGNMTVFVHSAFGERAYDWIALTAQNVTIANRTDAFSLEERLPVGPVFVEVGAQTGQQVYRTRVLVVPEPEGERVRVSALDSEGRWSDPRPFNLPHERILDREEASS